ncbi:MAG: hypothetical protein H7Z20_01790 [Bdellovibrio sp.]|nr:hypothetical protein [Methylotenera sp.]
MLTSANTVLSGEIYAKQTASKFVMYNVLKVSNSTNGKLQAVTLQNIDNPLSLFETTAQKLAGAGYVRISQTPYINMAISSAKKKKVAKKPLRCPYTLDFLEARADSQRPEPTLPDLFTL